ncbi:hypothetical protein E2C01_025468 [Portunus trituberculatus]|uniref:Uncharacterized protein n=1 Tax=Portunus trituberculatus TaxID=210409 RepID=A0A5B7EDF5_PORTR|nr:hypothetical protein [Portunus trituberculatus]
MLVRIPPPRCLTGFGPLPGPLFCAGPISSHSALQEINTAPSQPTHLPWPRTLRLVAAKLHSSPQSSTIHHDRLDKPSTHSSNRLTLRYEHFYPCKFTVCDNIDTANP